MTLQTPDWTTINDVDFARLLSNTEARNEMDRLIVLEAAHRIEAHTAAIAEAVQAERKACALAAGVAVMRVKTGTQAMRDMTLAEFRSVCSCAAEDAIKARGKK